METEIQVLFSYFKWFSYQRNEPDMNMYDFRKITNFVHLFRCVKLSINCVWINGTKFGLFPYAMRHWQKLSVVIKYEQKLPNFSEFYGGRAWSINLAITILEEWAFMWQWNSHWKAPNLRIFSSSIISRTVGEGKKARAKWAPSLGGDWWSFGAGGAVWGRAWVAG